jgi:hypothetical protein
MAAKQPFPSNLPDHIIAAIAAGPRACRPPNFASTDDVDYDIAGPEREAFLADFLAQINSETDTAQKGAFAAKWAHLKRNLPPLTDESST